MSISKWRVVGAAAVLAAAVASSLPGAEEAPPASTFGERLDVTAVTIPILVSENGRALDALSPADLEVFEDGRPVPVLSLERIPVAARGATAAPAGAAAVVAGAPVAETASDVEAPRPWRFLIYVDLQLSGVDRVREVAWKLGGEAERLTALGEVEVWVADDRAERVFGPSSDAAALRKVLRKRVAHNFGQRRLEQFRASFLENIDRPMLGSGRGGPLSERVNPNLALAAILQEGRLIESRRVLLEDVLAERAAPDWPQAAIVVSGGFDLVPREFYTPLVGSSLDEPQEVARLEQEFDRWSQAQPMERASRNLAALGWTLVPVVALELGAGFPGSAGYHGSRVWAARSGNMGAGGAPLSLLVRPLEPWQLASAATGGEVVSDPRQIDEAVDRLGERWMLSYQIARARDGSLHRVEVRPVRPGLEVQAPEYVSSGTPEAVAAGRARALLEGRPAVGDLAVTASVESLPAEGAKSRGKRGKFEARVEFASLGAARAALTSTTLRFTIAVPRSDGGVTIIHETASPADLSQRAGWIFDAQLMAAPATRKVAVVVEELGTGAWGSAVADWGN